MDYQNTLFYHKTALRRRGLLQPLPEDAERNLEERNPFTYIYVSPCQIEVSNDPYNQIPYNNLTPCNLTSYECPNLDTKIQRTATLTITYNYELHYKLGSDINATLETLEGSQLQHMASMTGLLQCVDISVSRIGNDRVLESDSSQKALIGISSFPLDTPDFQMNGCILTEKSSIVAESSMCIPIKGSMTATIDANASATLMTSIERSLIRLLRDGMQDDVYVSGNVTKVSFVGSRAPDVTTSSTSIQTAQQSKSKTMPSDLSIALICVALFTLFLILALFVIQRRKKKSEQSEMMFHDATISQDALNSDLVVHTRVAPSILYSNIEGADIVGSLANKDELALEIQAPTYSRTIIGDLSKDDPMTSFDATDYMADSLSFDKGSKEGETTNYTLEERNMGLPNGENLQHEHKALVSAKELNKGMIREEIVSLDPPIQVEDASDEEDEYSVAYKFT